MDGATVETLIHRQPLQLRCHFRDFVLNIIEEVNEPAKTLVKSA